MRSFSITDIGKRRKINEDYMYTSDKPVGNLANLFIVADGMGGHNAGEYASMHAVNKVVGIIEEIKDEKDPENIIQNAIDEANSHVYKLSRIDESLSGMGTTLVVASCNDNKVVVANVGDSRLYVINETIKQVKIDHSLVEEMVIKGIIDREAARNHPDKNMITRAIGVKEYVLIDFFEIFVEKNDKLLLCTDGLTNMLTDDEIHQIVNESKDISEAGMKLIDAANENGGRDNIAVVLVEPFGGQND